MDQAGIHEIARHLVRYPIGVGRDATNGIRIGLAESRHILMRKSRDHLRELRATRAMEIGDEIGKCPQLAGSEHAWMAREDLLDHRAARAWHSDDEDRGR